MELSSEERERVDGGRKSKEVEEWMGEKEKENKGKRHRKRGNDRGIEGVEKQSQGEKKIRKKSQLNNKVQIAQLESTHPFYPFVIQRRSNKVLAGWLAALFKRQKEKTWRYSNNMSES